MESETAKNLLIGITILAALVWLAGFQFLVSTAKKARVGSGLDTGVVEEAGLSEDRFCTGSAEVEGQSSVLADRAASLLARGAIFPHAPLRIVEKSEDSIRFEQIESGDGTRAAGYWLRQGQFSFTPLSGNRTRVEWVAELGDRRWLLRLGALFLVGGLIAIMVGYWAVSTYLVPSPEPAIRWQTIQMVQTCHFLWPPFLFGALYRRGSREVSARMDAFVHNLPYVGENT